MIVTVVAKALSFMSASEIVFAANACVGSNMMSKQSDINDAKF